MLRLMNRYPVTSVRRVDTEAYKASGAVDQHGQAYIVLRPRSIGQIAAVRLALSATVGQARKRAEAINEGGLATLTAFDEWIEPFDPTILRSSSF